MSGNCQPELSFIDNHHSLATLNVTTWQKVNIYKALHHCRRTTVIYKRVHSHIHRVPMIHILPLSLGQVLKLCTHTKHHLLPPIHSHCKGHSTNQRAKCKSKASVPFHFGTNVWTKVVIREIELLYICCLFPSLPLGQSLCGLRSTLMFVPMRTSCLSGLFHRLCTDKRNSPEMLLLLTKSHHDIRLHCLARINFAEKTGNLLNPLQKQESQPAFKRRHILQTRLSFTKMSCRTFQFNFMDVLYTRTMTPTYRPSESVLSSKPQRKNLEKL